MTDSDGEVDAGLRGVMVVVMDEVDSSDSVRWTK
jgi:hypothetical protein